MLKTAVKLGEILRRSGLVSEEHLAKALQVQRGTTKRLGEILVEIGLVTEQDIACAISRQLGIPFASSASLLTPKSGEGLEELVPEEFAQQHLVLPLSRTLDSLTVACVNPLDLITMDNLARISHCEINPVVTTKADIEPAIKRFYSNSVEMMLGQVIGQSYETVEATAAQPEEESLDLDRLRQAAEDAPTIRLVDLILRQAVKARASDNHFEPFKKRTILR